ncbi:MAG: pilus assembly protein TadG-related protein [Candidatus Sulfotelmatobacter sp.]
MLPPLIDRQRTHPNPRSDERGFTMALVTVALVTIIALAALSIDIGTLYQAKAEAQRAADAAALTAARMISISGITGDPGNVSNSWQTICGGTSSPATLAAINVAQQNLISGVPATSADVVVKYGGGSAGATTTNCSGAGAAFGVNPVVSVTVTSGKLPIFFARVFTLFPHGNFSNTTAVATATAEVFNSSNSASVAGSMIPVQPRCVKPLIIPNKDPTSGSGQPFVSTATGAINNQGISPTGAIGENFIMTADCHRGRTNCEGANMIANPPTSTGGTIHYLPALVQGTPVAYPSCANSDTFQEAIAGCDQTTTYACGTALGAQVDLTENPIKPSSANGDTGTAVQCLTHATAQGLGNGQDQIDTGSFPFQIQAGSDNPLVQDGLIANNGIVTTSSSIATIPIYDGNALGSGNQPQVTIVGFLQVFIQDLNGNGYPVVYVLNVSGCSNNAAGNPTVTGTSPVPIRLITPP